MRSLSSAARLLAQCTSVAATSPLIRQLGFDSSLVPLFEQAVKTLDLPDDVRNVHIAAGRESLRALVFEIRDNAERRAALSKTAVRLAAAAPQLKFLLFALDSRDSIITIAAFSNDGTRQRLHALGCDTSNVVDSDAETLCLLAAIRDTPSVLTHCRWLEILGRESIGRRFFRQLEMVVRELSESITGPTSSGDAAELALLYVSRLLFLSFLETKGWLNGDHAFLENQYSRSMLGGGGFHNRVLKPLFFGTLNTSVARRSQRAREFGRVPFLNGGLFNKSPVEIRTRDCLFPDETLGDVFGQLLTRYRFTAREDGNSWTEAAIDPEMLGKAFESLMSSSQRKQSGAFYTPQSLVRDVTRSALVYGLESESLGHDPIEQILAGSVPGRAARRELLARIEGIKVLDPACGSGAFLVHMLEALALLRVRAGDLRPEHSIRRDILTRSIFGVDINPTAVWLCELRLWLSMAIDDPEIDPLRVAALPNLDRNIRVGDALSGEPFRGLRIIRSGAQVAKVRARYARATGQRKKALARELDRLERTCAVAFERQRQLSLTYERRDILSTVRSRDLFGDRQSPDRHLTERLAEIKREMSLRKKSLQALNNGAALPFSFATGFADAANAGGFDLIVGNPPWVRTHNLDQLERARLREKFEVYRNSAWMRGSSLAGARRGFASQVDAAALFVERSIDLLRPGGAMSLILPAKLFRSLAGGGVRRVLAERTDIREIHDLTSRAELFEAAVYPSIITASRRCDTSRASTTSVVSHSDGIPTRWQSRIGSLQLDDSPGSPWLLAPREARAAFDRVTSAGIPVSETSIGRPLLGVKTGCNDAFVVDKSFDIEPCLLRKVIRGDGVGRWSIEPSDDRIIWTHDSRGPIPALPTKAAKWFAHWRRHLERRTDARLARKPWALFRTECMVPGSVRVVWADIGRRPRAAVLPENDDSVPLNTCYVIPCKDIRDALTISAILNSDIAAAWLALIAEPARGGYMRFMGWTISLLPLPRDWERAREILAPAAERGMSDNLSDAELSAAVLRSYRLTSRDVAPLLGQLPE
ncbi:MAG TPA: N-6 DNA methylase [Gemmatimonadaceae bacterium]